MGFVVSRISGVLLEQRWLLRRDSAQMQGQIQPWHSEAEAVEPAVVGAAAGLSRWIVGVAGLAV